MKDSARQKCLLLQIRLSHFKLDAQERQHPIEILQTGAAAIYVPTSASQMVGALGPAWHEQAMT